MRSLYQTALRLPHDQKDHKREQKTVLTLDTQTVESSQTTTYFCALWIGTVKTAKTTTNSCSAFSTTFGSCFDVFFLCKIDPKPRRGSQENALSSGSCTSRSVACGSRSPLISNSQKGISPSIFHPLQRSHPYLLQFSQKLFFFPARVFKEGAFSTFIAKSSFVKIISD